MSELISVAVTTKHSNFAEETHAPLDFSRSRFPRFDCAHHRPDRLQQRPRAHTPSLTLPPRKYSDRGGSIPRLAPNTDLHPHRNLTQTSEVSETSEVSIGLPAFAVTAHPPAGLEPAGGWLSPLSSPFSFPTISMLPGRLNGFHFVIQSFLAKVSKHD